MTMKPAKYWCAPGDCREMRVRSYKKDLPYSYTCGVYPTIELTDHCPSAVFRIVVSSRLRDGASMLQERASRLHVPYTVDDALLARLAPKENCFAVGLFAKYSEQLEPSRNHVVLVSPSDMGNLGTIIRTVTAFQIEDLALIRPCADHFDPRTVRASMGALFRIRVALFDSFSEYTDACGGSRSLYPFMLSGRPMETLPCAQEPYSLIFGNESSGLPEAFSHIGTPTRISHASTVDSLNLTVAAGIGMHWFARHAQNPSCRKEEPV